MIATFRVEPVDIGGTAYVRVHLPEWWGGHDYGVHEADIRPDDLDAWVELEAAQMREYFDITDIIIERISVTKPDVPTVTRVSHNLKSDGGLVLTAKLSQLTHVHGPNGDGKSALLNAIRLALCGEVRGLAGADVVKARDRIMWLAGRRSQEGSEMAVAARLSTGETATWSGLIDSGTVTAEASTPPGVGALSLPLDWLRDTLQQSPERALSALLPYIAPVDFRGSWSIFAAAAGVTEDEREAIGAQEGEPRPQWVADLIKLRGGAASAASNELKQIVADIEAAGGLKRALEYGRKMSGATADADGEMVRDAWAGLMDAAFESAADVGNNTVRKFAEAQARQAAQYASQDPGWAARHAAFLEVVDFLPDPTATPGDVTEAGVDYTKAAQGFAFNEAIGVQQDRIKRLTESREAAKAKAKAAKAARSSASSALAEMCEPLLAAWSARAQSYCSWPLGVVTAPAVRLCRQRGDYLDPGLSGGEAVRVEAAFAAALSEKLTGVKVLLIEGAELSRAALLELMVTLHHWPGQVVIASIEQPDRGWKKLGFKQITIAEIVKAAKIDQEAKLKGIVDALGGTGENHDDIDELPPAL